MADQFSHINDKGEANMVDVSGKHVTQRTAVAQGYVYMSQETMDKLTNDSIEKGDVFATARIAGIQAAKQTASLIPLCHPLSLSKVGIDFEIEPDSNRIQIQAFCKLDGKTGVEMEGLTAVSVCALTIFDMCKAVDPAMTISDIKVLSKQGGKTGDWQNPSGG